MSITREQVERCAQRQLERLIAMPPSSAQRGALARLRRGVGHHPGSQPQLWDELLLGMPQEMMNASGKPSDAEMAVYTALTLFALHQQSRDAKADCMHAPGVSIGRACAGLIKREDDRERVARRFNAMATASDIGELTHHLRGIVQLLRAEGIALDYAALAGDLYLYASRTRRDDVRLKWGQDFYREIYQQTETPEEDEDHA